MAQHVKYGIVLLVLVFFMAGATAQAARVEHLNVDGKGNFDIGPTQFSIEAAPGDTVVKELQLTNAKGEEWTFQVEVEDFQGSTDNPGETVMLQGDKSGKYSARKWVTPEMTSVPLKNGDRQFFNVTIKIPEDADPGDHYVSVLAKAEPKTKPEEVTDASAPNVQITSRAGALFFIRVKGPVKEEGKLESFKVDKDRFETLPVSFNTIFRNDGTVRLTPSGKIEIKNQVGVVVKEVEVEEFNVLRNSVRGIAHRWEGDDKWLFGKFTATLKLNRGYGDNVDTASVSFWILPMKKIAIMVGGVVAALIILIVILKKLHIQVGFKGKKKKKK